MLELICHQAVFRVSGIVLLLGASSGITRRLELALQGSRHLVLLVDLRFTRQDRRLDRSGLHDAQHFVGDRRVGRNAAKCNAVRLAVIEPASPTRVSQHVVTAARIAYRELTTAATAAQESGKQPLAAACCPGGFGTVGVRSDGTLKLLTALPTDVALMGVRNEREPLLPGFAP